MLKFERKCTWIKRNSYVTRIKLIRESAFLAKKWNNGRKILERDRYFIRWKWNFRRISKRFKIRVKRKRRIRWKYKTIIRSDLKWKGKFIRKIG